MRHRKKTERKKYMEFDHVVGWYSQKKGMKPLGGFLDIKSAKYFAEMKDSLFFGEGFFYIDSPEGTYINGYEKYSDHTPEWFAPKEAIEKQIKVYSNNRDRNILLDDFLHFEEYKRFKETGNLSQEQKQTTRNSIIDKLTHNTMIINSAENMQQNRAEKQHDNSERQK